MTTLRTLFAAAAVVPFAACTVQSGPGYRPVPRNTGYSSPAGAPMPVTACVEEPGGDAPSLLDHAQPIATGTFAGCLVPDDKDGDTFEVVAPPGAAFSLVDVTLRATDGWEHTCVVAYDGDREQQEHVCERALDHHVWFMVAAGTPAYLRVMKSPSFGSKEPHSYELSATISPINDADEPNSERPTAKPLTLGQPRFGMIVPAFNTEKDKDVYAIALTPGEYEVLVDQVAPELKLHWQAVNENGNQVGSANAGTEGASVRGVVRVRTAGTYFIAVDHSLQNRSHGHDDVPGYAKQPYAITIAPR